MTTKETDEQRIQRSAEQYARQQIALRRATRAALDVAAFAALDRLAVIMFEQPEATR